MEGIRGRNPREPRTRWQRTRWAGGDADRPGSVRLRGETPVRFSRRDMKGLVTGASGFIGSHLVDFLRAAGHSVVPLGRAECDVLDQPKLAQAIADAAPDVIFHLAAQSLPGQSWTDPQGTFRSNVEGTLNLLGAVRDHTPDAMDVIAC